MDYKRLNNITGWLVFLVATVVYLMTIESTASLWDCGEYITAANKLEVGHPPGAPFFMVLGRLFSFFASPDNVAVCINSMSALSSSFTILFMFWSITMLAKAILEKINPELTKGDRFAIMAAGTIGSLAYTFSDSFWFSAVEGEVYAMSSLFTAVIFWAILKWNVEMNLKKAGKLDANVSPMRWIVLIMFLFGLSIGVHLLGLLVIPAIAFIMYFNLWEKTTIKGIIITGIVSIVLLGFIQEGVIPGIVAIASSFEVGFVNSLGMPFFTGTIFFFLLLIGLIYYGFKKAAQKIKPILNLGLWGFVMLLIGYGTFAVIVIRSNANTPLDENDPENLVTLHSYLKREQYGSWPILTGPYWNSYMNGEVVTNGRSEIVSRDEWKNRSAINLRRFVVQLNDQDIKAFKNEQHALDYAKEKGNGYTVKEKYYCSNEQSRINAEPTYSQTTFLPRMYMDADDEDPKIQGYIKWSGYTPEISEDPSKNGVDGLRLPTMGENLTYMGSYQINWMYWRYFMWNFAGRQNDIQGNGDHLRGNYQTGYAFLDSPRLGSQEYVPSFTADNPSNNKFFLLPLVLGILGLIYHIFRDRKNAFVVFLTFLFTGLAIVVYLNQKPFEPRERDYAYAASFYAFAMWIGLGVLAIYDAYKNFKKEDWQGLMVAGVGLTCFVVIMAFMGGGMVMLTYLFCLALAAVFLLIGMILKSAKVGNGAAAGIIFVITFSIPYIMGAEGWDDHDRSGKTSARDLANNYLMSCAPNSILFTVGDNDTFPLWYLQEVEGKFTDIRVCNTSLFDTDWYTDQMKMKAYKSEPLPITFREDQILQGEGHTDFALMATTNDCMKGGMNPDLINELNAIKISMNKAKFNAAYGEFSKAGIAAFSALSATDPAISGKLAEFKSLFSTSADSVAAGNIMSMNAAVNETIEYYKAGALQGSPDALGTLQSQQYSWEREWALLPIDKAMEVVRNDNNLLNADGEIYRGFPCSGFIVPVDVDNAVKSQIITPKEKNQCAKEVRFILDNRQITKSDLMILDIMSNNDWKRALYFSSPGGTDVGMSLYRGGFLRQNGMAWEVTPVATNPNQPFNPEAMYNNIMNRYEYGDMNKKGVLTDYYARRQTSSFRGNFAQLANYYLQQAEEKDFNVKQYTPVIKNLRAAGRNKEADSLANTLVGADEFISDYKKRAVKLIQRSLEVMPVDLVIDFGEPSNGRAIQGPDQQQYQLYTDGNLPEYVTILYRAGAKKEAEKLGLEVTAQLEQTLNYFYHSDATFAVGDNLKDLSATISGLIEMFKSATDPEIGTPDSKLAKKLDVIVSDIYSKEIPRLYKELKQLGLEDSESDYSKQAYNLKMQIDAVGMYYHVIEPETLPSQTPPAQGNNGGVDPAAVLNEADLNPIKMDDTNAVGGGN